MTDFPKVIYLHDGQGDITWSECEEVDGVKYYKAYSLVRQDFEQWASVAGFQNFETNQHGCYEDDFLQHAYLGWEAASPGIEPHAYLLKWVDGEVMLKFEEKDYLLLGDSEEMPDEVIPLIPIYT